ncbi:uncharacterized protein LACBIDRAFT_298774 [Laccaria bicolor S238N-H82]|uniref:Predicted protein n=1 Tax=Laccaria bicolor (strain S238N-H82 / ATCC MYA-4686) TaxID=486041 RepID=B0E3F4_LACBS|nr:uncharacterized protein LACBIDRAFT_298774 [Laccaria bicolor S238N-H82]EDQ98623.1 predicted protein [Laccaria bicolor S238N-H82]|eukprot:XP_001890722.1 predicted protein [Laccaria bicolor S238N-H82]
MNINVGDLDLVAFIENPGERKKTICGTPNYVAPEVWLDITNGHSFEIKDVKAIYKRIRGNEYKFPIDRVISGAVQHLTPQILTLNPSQCPTLHEIVDHAFFTHGAVPSYIPSAHDGTPDFKHISEFVSDTNLKHLRKDDAVLCVGRHGGEEEYHHQHRTPFLMGNPTGPSGAASSAHENQLLRKLQAVKESPLGRRTVTHGLDGGIVEEEGRLQKRRMEWEDEHEEEEARLRKELEENLPVTAAPPTAALPPPKPNKFDIAAPLPSTPKPQGRPNLQI